jgi:dye decolorizing peroxidase
VTELSRRQLLGSLVATGVGAAAVGVGATVAVQAAVSAPPTGPTDATTLGAPVDPRGPHQAGITRPVTPQTFGLIASVDLADSTDLTWLEPLGAAILEVTSIPRETSAEIPDGSGDLTVTVGLGPRILSGLDATLPGAEALPQFAKDAAMDPAAVGGDLLLALYASDPTVLGPALELLLATVPGHTLRWSQHGFRAPGKGTVARNPLGFLDGVIVPHGTEELDENVWIEDGPAKGGTVCVIRRLVLDRAAFGALPVEDQEKTIGRYKIDGSPLSGGDPEAQVNLTAKSADGEYLVPARAHARAAHPSFTGSALMLRRGYAFDNGGADAGLMFICFQRDLRTFVATQQRLDERDALMDFATPTASASFLILPGFDENTSLGAIITGR